MRIYTDMDLVAAECAAARAVGRAVAERARRGAVGAGVRVPPPRRRGRPAAARAAGSSRCSPTWSRCGPTSTPSSATTSSTSCASPTSASRGRPTGGPRAPRLDEVLAETDLAAGDFVRWIEAAARPHRPGGRRRRRHRPAGHRAGDVRGPAPRRGGVLVGRRLSRRGSQPRLGAARSALPHRPRPVSQPTGRFSYGVDSTIVVRVETFAAARIRASRSSRSAGRGHPDLEDVGLLAGHRPAATRSR